MQIIIDGSESRRILAAMIGFLEILAGEPSVLLDPDDNPERGVELSGGVRESIDVTPVGATTHSAVPGLPSAATVFGANAPAAAPAAPVPPIPPAPAMPASIPTAANMVPPAPAPAASAAVLDVRGLPWDARIHSSTKARNADQTWRAKRNVDAALVPVVEAELQRLMGLAVATNPPAAAPAAPMPPMPPAAPVAAPMPPAAPAAPAAPVPAPPPGPAGQPNTFAELMTFLTPLMATQRVNMETITACLTECGIAALPLLGARQDLVPVVWTKILGRLQA